MNKSILDWMQGMREKFIPEPGDVLEVGSMDVNGSPRSVFQAVAKSYIGVDMLPGKGVDVLLDITEGILGSWLEDRRFDLVICAEMLEHCTDPLCAVRVMRQLLKPGGHLILTSPANGFPMHRAPRDYWRLMPDIYSDVFFRGMQVIEHATVRFNHIDRYSECWLGKLPT